MLNWNDARERRLGRQALQRYAARLDKWSARPLREANAVTLMIPLLVMGWVVQIAWPMPDRAALLRAIALMFVAVHVARHWWTIRVFRRLADHGLAAAATALAAYRDPRRISSLDLAALWLALAATAPMLAPPMPAQ
jgi:hypothetical protein